ncbi:MAG: hypothetical protein QM539_08975 [Alphaproteobacteria bacterium]|nr:hypothetical protein [Alphaproteobacteria bacterium]
MKHTKLPKISLICIVLIFILLFLPFVVIESLQIKVSGFSTQGTSFGNFGIIQTFFLLIHLIFILVFKPWSFMASILSGLLNVSWAIRNYIILTSCWAGTCPSATIFIYLYLLIICVLFVSSLLRI